MRWIVLALLALGLTGCPGGGQAKGGGNDDSTKDDASVAKPGIGESRSKQSNDQPDGGASKPPPDDTGTNVDSGDDKCVKECIHRSMARAVSAEMIRKDCETECADTQSPKE